MSDNSDQPRGGYDPADPWAPPNRDGVELSKPATPATPAPQDRPPVHDQPTMTAMPNGEVPPPPVAPGGPSPTGSYGYPTPPPVTAPAPSGYGYPGYPGYAGGGGYGQPGWQQPPSNGMGTASMVLGIIAVAGFCMYGLGVVLGILALVFGIIGRKKVTRGEANNGGMATAGIVLGSIGILVSAVFLAFIVWAITQGEEYGNSDDPFATILEVERR
ncbi:DUF4190 domain-containing protein [Streptomyces sp. P9(2023)]|uniref:DUF4190 domain-containing protein n=1 Tax=Streptomyces sp. P9(2023) TaxID=3064394 RepID=UPI0028F4046D|nr:DUF4190 domain-containing protein [Streptomyces sp. P9(2023)]MDT9690950.1 DUF4190 domain-containing protein [Streptomyces sp. P9(2023)]